uniref:Uncharacterized protein n=1 Tax=Kalanchoe fedtschenkoi TaxID=63787 RepID=A0A7N0RA18_KALFE
MLGFTAKKLLLLQRRCNVHKAVVLHHHSSKAFFYSTSIESDLKGDAFTVSYLVNSCGVAVNPAKRISSYLHLKSAEKPARTLSFFKKCGMMTVILKPPDESRGGATGGQWGRRLPNST